MTVRPVKFVLLWVLIMTVVVVGMLAWRKHVIAQKEKRRAHKPSCASCSSGGAGTLPLMDPEHNIREIIKQLVLLEDHCAHGDAKFCEDCVTKHALAAEALAEEAITLDTMSRFTAVLHTLASTLRSVQKRMWQGDLTPSDAAKEYRAIRKTLMPHANAMFG
jgi:hypothetical protein